MAIPFYFNENTKRLAAHEIELRWKKFNIHKFPLQQTNMSVLINKFNSTPFQGKKIFLSIKLPTEDR